MGYIANLKPAFRDLSETLFSSDPKQELLRKILRIHIRKPGVATQAC